MIVTWSYGSVLIYLTGIQQYKVEGKKEKGGGKK